MCTTVHLLACLPTILHSWTRQRLVVDSNQVIVPDLHHASADIAAHTELLGVLVATKSTFPGVLRTVFGIPVIVGRLDLELLEDLFFAV